ncbi:PHO85 cyclin-5 [Entomophthora muscae]|uniref:PHO85 cyclin-5 n=1 Tax=Entomophthora muscae TaxID=34485 RepID=A0ACC2TGE3_9FUNG|nr:PHO85 cyclin-5 [Entomophthora muscae]
MNIPFSVLGHIAHQALFEGDLRLPPTALRAFMTLLMLDTCSSPSIVIASIIYYRKLQNLRPDWVQKHSPCLLFTVCLSLGFKFLQDAPHFTMLWSRLSGFSPKQINAAEMEALTILDYQLQIHPHLFQSWESHFQAHLANHHPSRRQPVVITPYSSPPAYCRAIPRRKFILPPLTNIMPYRPYLPTPPSLRY